MDRTGAPAGTPLEIVARLNREVVKAIATPESAKLYEKMSYVQLSSTPAELAQKISRELGQWGPVISLLGISLEP